MTQNRLRLAVFFILFAVNGTMSQPCSNTLNGNYTVGPGGDFATLTAAAASYNNSCISGSVTFTLTASTYTSGESFPIVFDRNSNAGPNTTLLIKPGPGITSTISGSVSAGALLKIQGDYIIIDGSNNGSNSRNLRIINSSITEPRVIHFASLGTDAVTNCSLKNCELVNGNSDKSVVLISDASSYGLGGYCSNIVIENNSFKRALYGIYSKIISSALNGSGLVITSNNMNNSGIDAIQFTGIYLEGADGALIKDNLIGNFTTSDSATDRGIVLSTSVKNTIVSGNKISGLHHTGNKGMGAQGIVISSGLSNSNITISNNFISNLSGDGNDYTNALNTLENPTGILLNASTSQGGIRIYHNTIVMGGVPGYTNTLNKPNAISSCIRLRSGSSADIRNNIMVNNLGLSSTTGFGATALLISNSVSQADQLNYNDYYVNPSGNGVKLIAHVFSGNIQASTLASWRTVSSRDAASLNILPAFTSTTDLHLLPSANTMLNNKGSIITGYLTDIDNASRHPVNPDMGADEFIPLGTSNWIGVQSGNWSLPSNWEANVVADQSTDLELYNGYPYLPEISANAKVKNLTVSGLSNQTLLIVDSAINLEIFGTISRTNGCIDASKSTLSLMGTASQQLPEGFICNQVINKLVIGNSHADGVVLMGAIDIVGEVIFLSQGYHLNTNGKLTLKSSINATASIGDLTGKKITGDVTVERHIPTGINHGKSWQLLAVPVFGDQTINQAWQDSAVSANQNRYSGFGTQLTSNISPLPPNFDVFTSAGPSIKKYMAASNAWEGVPNTTATPIYDPRGYFVFVRGDRSVNTATATSVPTVLRAKGKLFTAATGSLPPVINISSNQFECIGNPYASAIDIRNIGRSGGVDNIFYVWDPTLIGTRGLGGYHTISANNGYVPIPGGTFNYPAGQPCTKIQSGQAFFMHATGNSGEVSFSEAAKTSGSSNTFRITDSIQMPSSVLNISLYSGTQITDRIVDGCTLIIDSAYQNNIDGNDAMKILNGGENLSISSHNKLFAVFARQQLAIGDTIQLNIQNQRKQTYQFRIKKSFIPDGSLTYYIYDKYTHQETLLQGTDTVSITFSVNDDPLSSSNDRFLLYAKSNSVLPIHFVSFHTRRNALKVLLEWQVADAETVSYYIIQKSLDGKKFETIPDTIHVVNSLTNRYSFVDQDATKGNCYYKIIAFESGRKIESPVSFVNTVEGSSISILPVPFQSNIYWLNFHERLNYESKILIYNMLGQPVERLHIPHEPNNIVLNLNNLSPGIYILKMSDISGNVLYSDKLIIK